MPGERAGVHSWGPDEPDWGGGPDRGPAEVLDGARRELGLPAQACQPRPQRPGTAQLRRALGPEFWDGEE